MIYKIRIILDAEEDIFRDVELEDNNTLEEFHNVISQAFGFMGNEMASFYTCNDQWIQDEEIALFDLSENDAQVRLMNETLLKDVVDKNTTKLIYVYDFINMWTFFVELADMVEEESGQSYPQVLFSFGQLPETPPEKKFKAEPTINIEDTLDNYDDLDFDENWN